MRLDSGVEEGDEVSVFYDPMLAKLIVRGADRPRALRALQLALAGWQSSGLPTNVPFLRRVCATDAFGAGHVHTGFIDEHAACDPRLEPRRGRDASSGVRELTRSEPHVGAGDTAAHRAARAVARAAAALRPPLAPHAKQRPVRLAARRLALGGRPLPFGRRRRVRRRRRVAPRPAGTLITTPPRPLATVR